jgi:hypothetical protein
MNRTNKIIAADPYEEKSSGCIHRSKDTHQRDCTSRVFLSRWVVFKTFRSETRRCEEREENR